MKIIKEKLKNKNIGFLGICLFGFSLVISKGLLNIGLLIIIVGVSLNLKKINLKELEISQKILLLLVIIVPIFSLISPGGTKSFGIEFQKSYRYIPFFLGPFFLVSRKKLSIFIGLGIISILINVIYGLLKYNGKGRLESITNILDTAHCLAILSFMVLFGVIYLFKKNKLYSLILGVGYLSLCYALLLTKGRGAWLGFLIGFLMFILSNLKIRKLVILIPLFIIIFLGLAKLQNKENNQYINRLESIVKYKNDNSSLVRLELWKVGIEIYKDNPILGIGRDNLKNYAPKYLKNRNSKLYSSTIKHAKAGNLHSMYFIYLAENGILIILLGAFFVSLYYEVLKEMILSKRQNSNIKYILLTSIFCSIIVFNISGLTEDVWRNFYKRNSLFYILIVFYSLKKLSNNLNKKS